MFEPILDWLKSNMLALILGAVAGGLIVGFWAVIISAIF